MKPEELFTPENTIWETDVDDEGNTSKHLVYVGSLEDLAKENNISVDKVYELLGEYEDMSIDLIEYEREIEEAKKEREIYKKVYKEYRLEDLYGTAQILFNTTLNDNELEKAFNRFEHIYNCDRTENDCLYEAVKDIIEERSIM